jgi:hypothetical protein
MPRKSVDFWYEFVSTYSATNCSGAMTGSNRQWLFAAQPIPSAGEDMKVAAKNGGITVRGEFVPCGYRL